MPPDPHAWIRHWRHDVHAVAKLGLRVVEDELTEIPGAGIQQWVTRVGDDDLVHLDDGPPRLAVVLHALAQEEVVIPLNSVRRFRRGVGDDDGARASNIFCIEFARVRQRHPRYLCHVRLLEAHGLHVATLPCAFSGTGEGGDVRGALAAMHVALTRGSSGTKAWESVFVAQSGEGCGRRD